MVLHVSTLLPTQAAFNSASLLNEKFFSRGSEQQANVCFADFGRRIDDCAEDGEQGEV